MTDEDLKAVKERYYVAPATTRRRLIMGLVLYVLVCVAWLIGRNVGLLRGLVELLSGTTAICGFLIARRADQNGTLLGAIIGGTMIMVGLATFVLSVFPPP